MAKKTSIYGVELTHDEVCVLDDNANARGLSREEWIRWAVIDKLESLNRARPVGRND